MAEQSACEPDFAGKTAVDAGQLLLVRVYPHRAFQMVEDLFLAAARHKLRIGLERELDQASLYSGVLVTEGIGKRRKHPVLLCGVFPLFLPLSADFAAVSQQFLEPRVL